MTKARDIADFKFEDIVDTGTEGTKVAVGTTAQRGSTTGQIRFNSTTGLAEYYDGNAFKPIDSPPTISGVSPTNVGESTISSNPSVIITGSNFSNTVTVKIIGDDGTEITPNSTTRNSNTQITITLPSSGVTNANEAYDIRVTNSSGLDFTLANAFNVNATPVFSVASGSLGTLAHADRAASNLTAVTATDSESSTITFSITTGSAPTGLTFNSNGTWSGTADAVNSDTTSNFTVTATDGGESVTRDYSITVEAELPAFTNAAGSLGSIFDSQRSSYSINNPVATIGNGTISGYTIQSGSLPSGLSMNATTGAISGTASAVGTDTTSTFTVRATASIGTTADREYTILVKAPVTQTFSTSSSSQTFDTTNIKGFTAYLWGAGGNSSQGGFVQGDVSVDSSVNTLYIVVGNGGGSNDTSVWRGGRGNGGGGSRAGGGFTGIFTGSSPSQGNAVLIAGGGGSAGSNNNNGPYNGGNHSSSANNCCGTNGASGGSALQGGSGGGGSQPGGGGGGGYVGGGGGGGACCSGAGGRGGSHYTSGDAGYATTSNTSTTSNQNSGHSLWQSNWGGSSSAGKLIIQF